MKQFGQRGWLWLLVLTVLLQGSVLEAVHLWQDHLTPHTVHHYEHDCDAAIPTQDSQDEHDQDACDLCLMLGMAAKAASSVGGDIHLKTSSTGNLIPVAIHFQSRAFRAAAPVRGPPRA